MRVWRLRDRHTQCTGGDRGAVLAHQQRFGHGRVVRDRERVVLEYLTEVPLDGVLHAELRLKPVRRGSRHLLFVCTLRREIGDDFTRMLSLLVARCTIAN